jgi:hypothetical protein
MAFVEVMPTAYAAEAMLTAITGAIAGTDLKGGFGPLFFMWIEGVAALAGG